MGESTARAVKDAVKDIGEARERLQDDFEELASRLPRLPQSGDIGPKVVVPAVGAVAGGLVIWLADRSRRKRKRAARAARAAEEAAAQAVPEELMDVLRDGGWKGPAVVAVGIWGVLKIAEARSVRRLSKALVKANAKEQALAQRKR